MIATIDLEVHESGRKVLAQLVFRVSVLLFVLFQAGCYNSSFSSPLAPLPRLSIYEERPFTLTLGADARLSFSFSPLELATREELYVPTEVKPHKTRWGTPWNHEDLCRNMNAILAGAGVSSFAARVRMIAHAIVASGWRQNVWNYNAWGVQQGSWRGPYYEMYTEELDEDGNVHKVPDAAWRSFESWGQAVDDFHARINPDSPRPSYRQAYRHLMNPSRKADSVYWSALGDGNYYTARHFDKKKFAMLCRGVREILSKT